MPLQQPGRRHHLVVRGRAAFRHPVTIMQVFGAITAQSHEKVVLLEEHSPLLGQQCAVGLQIILDPLMGFLVFRFQRDDLAEEVHPQQRRFAALPTEHHLVARLRLDVLPDVFFEQFVRHVRPIRLIQQILLVQVIAVGAVEVAQRTTRLNHRVKAMPVAGRQGCGLKSGFQSPFTRRHRCRL